MELHADQRAAVHAATSERFHVITGCAGTGKTTIIGAIASTLGNRSALCAVAGKAAARLREATGRPASTIARLLKYDGTRYNAESLEGQAIIVDEASMVSSDLMAQIMTRNPDRVILVGDEAQLPPVGRGQPFHDLIALRPDLVTNLTKCWRQSEAVFRAAQAIRVGEAPARKEQSAQEYFEVRNTGGAESTQAAIMDLVRSNAIDFTGGRDLIMAPKNGKRGDDGAWQPCTVNALNEAIVAVVNPRERGDQKFMIGDRVMNLKNFAAKDVWNGTTGTVHGIDYAANEIWVDLDVPTADGTALVLFDKDMIPELTLAYAVTVHKAQGSQARRVVFACLHRDSYGMDQAMAYTAVTRTQEACIVVGDKGALDCVIRQRNSKPTVLQEMIRTSARQKAAS